MKILSVVGARPNFMKVAPIILAVNKYNQQLLCATDNHSIPYINHVLVHTGQHYDKMMSETFFEDLNLPKMDIFLGIRSGSHAVQTAEIMKRFENVLLQEKPDIMLVVGDVNSTLACALVASKISFDSNGSRPLIAHIEAGLRSYDRTMPEEVNRILTDHISDLLFVTEQSGIDNLENEGIQKEKIFFVGNTMIDTLLRFKEKADKSRILSELGLIKLEDQELNNLKLASPYVLLTLHRPSNVDNKENFENIIQALKEISTQMPVIFPVHPRTKNQINKFGLDDYFNWYEVNKIKKLKYGENAFNLKYKITLIEPLGYLDFLCLMKNASMVLTDSGGIQEETTCLGVPCITIRENTERPITVTQGTNMLAGVDKDKIKTAFAYQLSRTLKKSMPPNWDGKAAYRIIEIIVQTVKSMNGNKKFILK